MNYIRKADIPTSIMKDMINIVNDIQEQVEILKFELTDVEPKLNTSYMIDKMRIIKRHLLGLAHDLKKAKDIK